MVTRVVAVLLAAAALAAAPVSAQDDRALHEGAVRSLIAGSASACGVTIQEVTAGAQRDAHPLRAAGREVLVPFRFGATGSNLTARFFSVAGRATPASRAAGLLTRKCSSADPGVPKTADEVRSLPYLEHDSGGINAVSGPAWGGRAITLPPTLGSAIEQQLYQRFMWALTCSSGPQVASFRRSVYLLGPPRTLQIGILGRAVRNGRDTTLRPFAAYEVYLNNVRVYRSTRAHGGSLVLPQVSLNRVVVGMNRFEIRVLKKRTGPCNRAGGLQLGVGFSILGDFITDLAVSEPDFAGSQSSLHDVKWTITNNGPSAMAEPIFWGNVSAPSGRVPADKLLVQIEGLPDGACLDEQTNSSNVRFVCSGTAWPSGGQARARVLFVYQAPDGNFLERLNITWAAPGLLDPTSNNGGTRNRTVCRPLGAPGCAPPP